MTKNKEKLQISPEVREEAMRVAQATKKPGQSKEQTKLIAQGIQKGIAQYKKQQKAKSREADKHHKKELRAKAERRLEATENHANAATGSRFSRLPWLLLVLSWSFFVGYHWLNR